jgi:hypothetical protein
MSILRVALGILLSRALVALFWLVLLFAALVYESAQR